MNLLPASVISSKGHLKQEFKNLQSTDYKTRLASIKEKFIKLKSDPNKSVEDKLKSDITDNFFPTSDTPNERYNHVLYSIVDISPTGLGYTDPTGRFPYRSAKGKEYIFVASLPRKPCLIPYLIFPLKYGIKHLFSFFLYKSYFCN